MLVVHTEHQKLADSGVVLEVGTDAGDRPRRQKCGEPAVAMSVLVEFYTL